MTRLDHVNALATKVRQALESREWAVAGNGITAEEMLELDIAINRLVDRCELFRTNTSTLRQIGYEHGLKK